MRSQVERAGKGGSSREVGRKGKHGGVGRIGVGREGVVDDKGGLRGDGGGEGVGREQIGREGEWREGMGR